MALVDGALAFAFIFALGVLADELARWWWRRGKVPTRPLERFTSVELDRMEVMTRSVEFAAKAIEQDARLCRANVNRVKWLRRTEVQPAIDGRAAHE